jgi:DNA-binding LacI/PurR family transcriptional regulator
MRGISVYAQECGYMLLYSFSSDEEDEVSFIRNYLKSGWVSGIVLLAARNDDRCVSYLKNADFPFVVIGHPEDPMNTCWVDNDNFKAMYRVTNYLIEKGYRRIGFIGGPRSFRVTQDRLNGYRQALDVRGYPVEDSLIFTGNDFSEASGRAGGELILSREKTDAVVTTDDQLAFGLLDYLEETDHGNIAVTGFNNTVRGIYQSPSLTSVDVNPELLGRRAAELLIGLLETDKTGRTLPSPNHYLVDTRMIVRETA